MTPLAGVRVVEVAQLVSAPYCGTLLAELGADVVKVEPPHGDMSRQFGPFLDGESVYYRAVNRGKRCLTLDLSSADGRAVLMREIAGADVLLHNLRVGAARRLGVTAVQLQDAHPRLVVCEVSAFGADDDRVGVDLIFQAESGLMRVTGHPGGPPTRVGTNVPDFYAAMCAFGAVLGALRERDLTGRAPAVSLSLLGASIAMQTCWFAAHGAGADVGPLGNASPFSSPTGSFNASDREVVVSVVNDEHWRRLCAVLDRPDLAADRRFADNQGRCEHRAELQGLLAPAFTARAAADWQTDFRAAGLPVALALDYAEVREAWPQFFTDHDGVTVPEPPFRLTSWEPLSQWVVPAGSSAPAAPG